MKGESFEEKKVKTLGEEIKEFMEAYDEPSQIKEISNEMHKGLLYQEAFYGQWKYQRILEEIEKRKALEKANKKPANAFRLGKKV